MIAIAEQLTGTLKHLERDYLLIQCVESITKQFYAQEVMMLTLLVKKL
jgi:hypothetical protein